MADGPRIFGVLEGQSVSIRVLSERRQDDEVPCTFFHVAYSGPLPVAVQMSRKSRADGDSRPARDPHVPIGDPKFDPYVSVTGSDPDAILAFLTVERRRAIRQMFEALDDCKLDDQGLLWKKLGVEKNPAAIVRVTRRMVDVAVTLTRES
jgi:hypothetical protein